MPVAAEPAAAGRLLHEPQFAARDVVRHLVESRQPGFVAARVQAQGCFVRGDRKESLPHDAAGVDPGRHFVPRDAVHVFLRHQRPRRRVQPRVLRQRAIVEVDRQLPRPREQRRGQNMEVGDAEEVVEVRARRVDMRAIVCAHGLGALCLRPPEDVVAMRDDRHDLVPPVSPRLSALDQQAAIAHKNSTCIGHSPVTPSHEVKAFMLATHLCFGGRGSSEELRSEAS